MTSEEKLTQIVGVPVNIKQVAIGKHVINYAVAGKGPPLLLIHGANFGWGVWHPNIAALAKHFTVYALDLPGAGRSSRIDYAKMDVLKDLFAVVEDFVIKADLRNLNVMGCSIGGWLTLKLALEHPDRVNKIVVENSVGFSDYMSGSDMVIGLYPVAKLIARVFINPNNPRKVERFLRGIFYDQNLKLPTEFIDYFFETMQTSHNLLFISRLTALHRQLSLESQLPGIKHKTLIIWGKEDKIIPLHKNLENFKLIPQAEVSLIEQAAHIPSLEKPQEYNELAINFLTRT